MGKYIDKGNDGFASIRNSNFVDKSLLITQVNSMLMTDNRFLCVTRARRFGKSVAMKSYGKRAVKIAGCELWLKIIAAKYKTASFYLVGSKQKVIEKTVEQLKSDFPGIKIAGYRNGYIRSDDEKRQLVDDIASKKPDVVFVAMGSPKQELLMEEMQQKHPAIYQGLGGSFDVYTGNVKRAPKWWVDHNLEFAYRLVRQPSRIKRQIFLVKFLALVKLGKI